MSRTASASRPARLPEAVVSSTTISTVPPAGAGAVDVSVVNPDDQSATLVEGFVYLQSTGPVFGDRFENRND